MDKIVCCEKCGGLKSMMTWYPAANASATSAQLLAPLGLTDLHHVTIQPQGTVNYAPPMFYTFCTCLQEAQK